jgi:hypothetical protein
MQHLVAIAGDLRCDHPGGLTNSIRGVFETSPVVINSGNRVWRLPLSASPQQPVRECHPVQDHVPDTPALGEPVAVVERVVNAAIEAGEGRFFRGLLKGGERPWGLGGQGDRILIPCNDVDRRLESDLITGS